MKWIVLIIGIIWSLSSINSLIWLSKKERIFLDLPLLLGFLLVGWIMVIITIFIILSVIYW
jgi:hypothetical protein